MQNSVANLAGLNSSSTLRLGTRTSQLALWQTNHVMAQLQAHWPQLQYELVHHITQGDKRLDRPLPEIGGKGLFTAELEEALRRGEIDIAVHSLKDLPVEDAEGLIIGAILSREDTRDVLVARQRWTLATLPKGAIIGTSSLRRQAQLLAARPDLDVRSIRGNVDTRLRKVMSGEYDAAVMAGAGLSRLGLTEHIVEWLAPETMLPAPGQGALAVQCRADDPVVHTLLSAIHDSVAAATTTAERQLLFRLGGGCSAPVGAWAVVADDGQTVLRARIASVDGCSVFDASGTGNAPDEVAALVAEQLLAQGALVALSRAVRSPVLPMSGKRIVVTRPKRSEDTQGSDLAELLRNQGALILEIPAIELVPTPDAALLRQVLNGLSVYDWVIFTSPNAVEHFMRGVADLAVLNGAKVAAVGPATRATLESLGVNVAAMPETYLGAAIAAVLGDIAGKRILLPRSAQGGRELPAALREQGATVDEIALYSPQAVTVSEENRIKLAAGVDVVTFASGSAVRAFANALRSDPRFENFWSKVKVACIGPTTAEVAQSEGLSVHIVAAEHSAHGLVAALVAHFEQGTNNG